MSSLDEANHFVNCVMSRYKSDTIMNAGATLLLIAIPFMALGLGLGILSYTDNVDGIMEYLSSVVVMTIWFIFLIMMFLTYRRLNDHSNRDKVWRDILVHYAKEKGCNTTNLERLDRRCRKKDRTLVKYPAYLILTIYFLLFVFTVCYPKVIYYGYGIHLNALTLVIVGGILNFLMFILVYTYSMGYPYRHEFHQVRFVKEFRYIMYRQGIDVPEMVPSVRHTWIIIHIFLFMFTWGLYSIYLFFMVYRSTNNHLYNQWSYEIRLMNIMVHLEGGKGIEQVLEPKKGKKGASKDA